MSDQPRTTQYRPVDELRPAELNPKDHDLDVVERSIRRFGFVDGAVHDGRTDRIIAGHGRREALQRMLARGEPAPDGIVPALDDDGTTVRWLMPVQMGWSSASDDEAEALLLVLNRATELGGWIDAPLEEALTRLAAVDRELFEASGFTDDDLAALRAAAEPDEAEPDLEALDDVDVTPAVEPISRLGDVWQLGEHRVTCGDARHPDVVARVARGQEVDCVWTDPPYGVEIVGGSHALSPEERRRRGGKSIENDNLSGADLEDFLRRLLRPALDITRPGGVWYVAAPPGPLFASFGNVLRDWGVWRQTIAWVKNSLVMGRSDYHYRHEAVFYGWKPGAAHQPPPDRKQDTVWEIPRPARSNDHPTMKPVELVARALRNSTHRGGLVLDVCGGSGTTLIACEALGRRAAVVELSPGYTDVICRRWQQMTGRLPVRARTGEQVSFPVTDGAAGGRELAEQAS